MAAYYIEGAGDDEMQEDYAYPDAVAALDRIRDEMKAGGWVISEGWASRDNLAGFRAYKSTARGTSEMRDVQIVIATEDNS